MTIAPSATAPAADGLLALLDAEQRAAATLPDGPAQVIAPAGSGKTTTLIARLGVLLGRGVAADRIGVVTFNRDAAAELSARIASRLAPDVPGAEAIEVRTLHAMARQVLIDAGRPVRLLPDRIPLLRAARRRALAERPLAADGDDPPPEPPDSAALDTIVSVWKVEGRPPPPEAAAAVNAFAAMLAIRGQVDFDDLVVGAVGALEADPQLRSWWQGRFSHLCVDEFQDVDAAQLRLIRLLAAPEDNLFVVGDDDQTIYAWRLADVRRVIGLAAELPRLRRIDLVTNYRCPPPVVARAVRLVEHNRERFAKQVLAGPQAHGRLLLVADGADEAARARRLLASWRVPDGESMAILARTNAELTPYAAGALELGIPYRAADDGLLLDAPEVDQVLAAAESEAARRPGASLLEVLVAVCPSRPRSAAQAGASLLAWAPGCADATDLRRRIEASRARRRVLRRDDAALVLATAHGTKGLEFDHVCCVGLDEGRFPSARSLAEAADPARVLEEERRLAYVAWTRARRSLLLLHDPHAPSIFLREAFDPDELAAA